jgi:hypothetical protein
LADARRRVLRVRELLGNASGLPEVVLEMRSLRRDVVPAGLTDVAVLARAIEHAAERSSETGGEHHLRLAEATRSLDLLLALVELDSGWR